MKLHHPGHVQVAHQKNLTNLTAPRRVEPAQCREHYTNKHSVEVVGAFPYLKHVENITDSESQPPQPALRGVETYPGTGPPLSDYIAESWERNAQGSLETKLQNNP